MITLKYKKLREDAQIPVKQHLEDACYDLTACEVIVAGSLMKCKFGIAVEFPPGYVALIFPRSSVYKTSCRLSNSVGVVDANYRGELQAVFDLQDSEYVPYKTGERCCQLMLIKLPEVELKEVSELSSSERGDKGFGSSGR